MHVNLEHLCTPNRERHIISEGCCAVLCTKTGPPEELAELHRNALAAFEELEQRLQQAKRHRTRSGVGDDESALDTSALLASILEIAKRMGGEPTAA